MSQPFVPPTYLTASATPPRHPLDPQEHASTKAIAVLVLGITAVALMFCIGGVAPAIVALGLARSTRAELHASSGFLTGEKMVRAGVTLSWIAIGVGTAIAVVALVSFLLQFGTNIGPDYGENVD